MAKLERLSGNEEVSDFPHVKGTYPSSRRHLAKIFGSLPKEEVAAIVGTNAAAMMKLRSGKALADPSGQDSLAQ